MIARQPWWFWWMGVSALLVCIGSMGPWATVLFITVGGLNGDGQFTLVLGLAALVFLAVYVRSTRRPRPAWPVALIVLAGLAAGLAGAYDWSNLHRAASDAENEDNIFSATISVGWGLVVMTVAGFSLAVAGITTYARRPHEPEPAAAPSSRARMMRECPHCKEDMRRDASICPHCRAPSKAWTLHGEHWWIKTDDGSWYYLDEAVGEWKPSGIAGDAGDDQPLQPTPGGRVEPT
jgi:hypothetical protein